MSGQAVWKWLSNPDNQQTVAWVGGGVAAVITGLWAVFKFLRGKPSVSVSADRGSIAAGGDAHVGMPSRRAQPGFTCTFAAGGGVRQYLSHWPVVPSPDRPLFPSDLASGPAG